MSSPDEEGKPAAAPLDADREQLRKAGYTDAEVSQILIARAALQQPAGIGQGAMSNVLSSILGVASHARALIPTFRKDVETVFDGAATPSARAGATASLAVKVIVVVVLGFAAWQEWRQHILYAPEIANEQLQKTAAERREAEARADVARHVAAGEQAKADAASNSFVNSPFMRPFMEPAKVPTEKISCADYRLGAAAMGLSGEQWRAKVQQAERDGRCVAGPKRSRAKLRAEYKEHYVSAGLSPADADKAAERTANDICDNPNIVGYSIAGCDP